MSSSPYILSTLYLVDGKPAIYTGIGALNYCFRDDANITIMVPAHEAEQRVKNFIDPPSAK